MKVRWTPFGKIMELQRRRIDVELEERYSEIGVRSFRRGVFIKAAVRGVELGDKRVFQIDEGDLVISNVFAWEGAVGLAGPEHRGMIGSHRFMTWTPIAGAEAHAGYLCSYLSSDIGVSALASASPGSAGRNGRLLIKIWKRSRFQCLQCRINAASPATSTNFGGRIWRIGSAAVGTALQVSPP